MIKNLEAVHHTVMEQIGEDLESAHAELAQMRVELERARTEAERRNAALVKISTIRDSIVGTQSINWSEHIYPLVAALGDAGYEGAGYEISRANMGTLIERHRALTALAATALAALSKAVVKLEESQQDADKQKRIRQSVERQLEATREESRRNADHFAERDIDSAAYKAKLGRAVAALTLYSEAEKRTDACVCYRDDARDGGCPNCGAFIAAKTAARAALADDDSAAAGEAWADLLDAARAIVEHDTRVLTGGYLKPHEGETLRQRLRAALAKVDARRGGGR